ncbi:MAG: T9SS type A sorting domain-containing protein [Dyadobacter sp.]|uniref:M12 family metallo-peptidase n=1 Tax=Dyadobacter sp. TaxID=1914288 RepID=UPI001B0BA693|nr:M12 family metallo-peptidase [Dyadobacter sp.]MBO9611547.1 T9SS type A sorting domain-containing protein [Dyadobacter sp.]
MKTCYTFKILIIILLSITSRMLTAQQAVPSCGTNDSLAAKYLEKISKRIDLTRARTANQPVLEYRLGVDIDHKTYLDYGGDVMRIRRRVYEIFREASAIFEEEMRIKLTVYHIHIWDKPEPYALTTSEDYFGNVLTYWNAERHEVRDAVVGMSNRYGTFYGGFRMCTSNFPDPNQYFSIDLLCHELGHTLGSPHTHNCFWPGGPIDRCVAVEGTSESCLDGFREEANGTIMSYCLGEMTFHPLCRNLIRNYAEGTVNPAFKLTELEEKPAAPGLISKLPGESGGSAALPAFEWYPSAKASRYRVQIARDAGFQGIMDDTLVTQPFFRSPGLNPGNYFVRYQPQNASSSAEWSQALSFNIDDTQTQGAPPVLLSVALDNEGNIVGSFRALSGITAYQVRTSEQWRDSEETFDLIPKGTAIETFSLRPEEGVVLRAKLRYRVFRNNQWSVWSDNINVVTIPTSAPLRSNPVVSTDPILAIRQWTPTPTAGPVSGIFQLATDPEFKNLVIDELFTHPNAPNNGFFDKKLLFPTLAENTTYYSRSNIGLKTGFQSLWANGQFRTGVKDTRFTYLGVPHPAMLSARGSGSYIRTMKLFKSREKLFVASTLAGYYETTDLETWTPFLPSTTNGQSPERVTAITAYPDGITYTVDGLDAMVKKTDNTYTRLPLPPLSGVSGMEDLFATETAGLFYMNYTAGITQFLNGNWISHNAALQSLRPICLAKDNKDRIWTITEGGATWYFENNQWVSQPRMPFWNALHGLAFDNDNNAYAYGNWGVMGFNKEKGEWEVIRPLFDKSIQRILFDDQNRMWLVMYRWPEVSDDDFTQFGLLRYANGKVNAYTEGLNFLREPFEIEFFKGELVILTTGGELHTFDERQILSFEPQASYPAGSSVTVKLSTNSTFDAENRISIQLNNQTTGAQITLTQTTVNGHAVDFTLPDTLRAGQYTINLLTTAPEIMSHESQPFRVVPKDSPTNTQPDEVTLLQNTPNPATGPTEIAFYLPQAAEARIDLFNVRGQFIRQLRNTAFPGGWNFIQTDLADLRSGVYVYRLTTGKVVKSLKLIH